MPASALLLALLVNAAWAFNFIAGKVGVDHFQPLFFTALRFALLLALLAPFLRPVRGSMGQVLAVAATLGGAHFALMFLGLAAGDDVAPLALVTQAYVPLSVLLAVLVLGERLGRRRALGVALACAGVLVIGFDPVVFRYWQAVAYILGAALAMAWATILMRGLRGVGVFTLQAWIAAVAVPVQLGLSLLFESGQWRALASADWLLLAAPAYSAVGASILGHGVLYFLLRRYPVTVITPLMLLTPVLAVLFGVWLLDDRLGARVVLGGALTLAGVALSSFAGTRAERRPR